MAKLLSLLGFWYVCRLQVGNAIASGPIKQLQQAQPYRQRSKPLTLHLACPPPRSSGSHKEEKIEPEPHHRESLRQSGVEPGKNAQD
ncbi:hypothetical protein B0H67DRAFT_292889 [Lasiosphaeris hirsuta]|uniref:Secreted protein n=1 Tax=Lasiosphaeris hirsuta TaxID=260670 RepID=A0AA40DQ77_9PEZI|nr:hypothetical protein B0H67DRAFT_292889 [Lasiosphaeris hirsuta]